jgi:predicted nucleic acid-binding protein
MPLRCAIDTSILVRLATGEPAQNFDRVVAALTQMVEVEHIALFASHMVIGEAYVALQHHYGVNKPDAKAALRSLLSGGLVAPSGGDAVLEALGRQRGCGLLDRLIALQYSADELSTLTLDRKMAALPNVTRLVTGGPKIGLRFGASGA